jgi:gamma-glutamyltranspeptidase / glutathione hydrolase
MMRNFQFPGRSPVLASDGMAATSHPLATLAAIDTLKAGGTAADAAVTAVATLCVVEPAMTGIGGDCFCLVAKDGAPVWGYNGSGRSGAASKLDTLTGQGLSSIAIDSIHSITVPGAVEAWEAILKAHGRFGLDRALAPAIRYAEQGAPVAPRIALDWSNYQDKLRKDANAARHYLFGGRSPAVGDIVKFPALAQTLRQIAAGGAKAFYQGDIAADILATIVPRGSLLTADDFARHRGDVVEALSSNYRGLDVVELPPNGQGLAALVLLNILERFDLAALEPHGAERLHIQLEAARLAYAVRDTHVADPAYMRMSVPALLDKAFAGELADKIDRGRRSALPKAPTPGSNTVYVTVVDRDRTAVSMINSLFWAFGCGIATGRTGIMLQNRGAGFTLAPDHPNTLAPNKRPMHTIIPALTMRDGRCETSFGVMGGGFQAMGHAHVVANMVDFGMDPQAALDSPRVFFDGDATEIETGLPPAAIEGLKARGHTVVPRALPFGGGQIVQIDWQRGVLTGASDFRKDGCALGY